MDKGITLLAIGQSGIYAKWAANMAVSIKVHNPHLPINLVADKKNERVLRPEERPLFNEVIPINPDHTKDCFGNFSPGYAKLNIYEYCRFEQNIYLDCDGLCVRELNSLFGMMKKDVHLQLYGKWDQSAKEWTCSWMPLSGVRFNYNLPDKFDIYECNSSFIYFKKGEVAKNYFDQAKRNFIHNFDSKIWGNAFPDELAFNVATAQTGIDPTIRDDYKKAYQNHFPVCFNIRQLQGKRPMVKELQEQTYFIGLYGGLKPEFSSTYSVYDGLAQKYNRQLLNRHNIYKTGIMMERKHVSTTTREKSKDDKVRVKIKEIADLRTGIFTIEDTIKIELLPSEYNGYYCFNGSLIHYNGKDVLAFRKDRAPYGKSSRIFIAELQDFKQVLPAVEVTGLIASPGKGYEDPRLLINDGLILVYNDNHTQYEAVLADDYSVISCQEIELPKLENIGDGRKKNISPFVDEGLKYIYSAAGSHIVPGHEPGMSVPVDYGTIRGGSPAIKIGEKFYTAFHTCLNFEGFQHFRQYGMGVYEFDQDYNVTSISKPLLIAPYTEDRARMYPNVFVVFPVGLYEKDGIVYISFGYQDNEIRVLKLTTKEFIDAARGN